MHPLDTEVVAAAKRMVVSFGAERSVCKRHGDSIEMALKIPQLYGPSHEEIGAFHADEALAHGAFQVLVSQSRTAGVAVVPIDRPLDQISRELYQDLFEILGDRRCYRIWNYVPYINDVFDHLERYRSFNIGRWDAYRQEFGDGLCQHMPAASAVGIEDDIVALAFAGGTDPVDYVENPEQVPAYDYPVDYGPRAPSFARGATVRSQSSRLAYLSGTSSIKGHTTVGEGCLETQFQTTLHNLKIVAESMDVDLNRTDEVTGFKVYLRNPGDLAAAKSMLENELKPAAGRAIYLNAAICRSTLNIEIEATARLIR